MKNIMNKSITFCLLFMLIGAVSVGCQKEGPMEQVGERADEIVDNVKDGDPILKKKGSMEKAGDAIDETVEDAKDAVR